MALALVLLRALLLTIAAEGLLMLLLRRSWRDAYAVTLCNLLTNPVMNLLLMLLVRWLGRGAYWPALFVLELGVFFTEGLLLPKMTTLSGRQGFFYAAVLNGASLALGLVWN